MGFLDRIAEFGIVLGISAVVGLALNYSITGLGYAIQYSVTTGWVSFFVLPMIYYKLFHFTAHNR